MKISKHYEENIQTGNFLFTKIGLTIHSDKELKDIDEIKEHSNKLTLLAKQLVQKELQKIKIEKQNNWGA